MSDLDSREYVKEEPDCYRCADTGTIQRRWSGKPRQCPDCSPTDLDVLRARLWWFFYRVRLRLSGRLRDGEVPF